MNSHSPHPQNEPHGKRRLLIALCITGCWFVIELGGGIYANSLALIADAAHMLTDLAALGLSLFALKISARPATPQKTFGYLRAEILAALTNGVILVVIALYIFYESYQRLLSPPEVKSLPMLGIASAGLLANLAVAGLLFRSRKENLNLRGAFLHVLGDTMGSVGAILAGILMVVWQWYAADPVISVIVGALILYGSWQLVGDSVNVLLEGTPRHLDVERILSDLGRVPGVLSVHDLHVWSIDSGTTAMSCHLVVKSAEDADRTLAYSSRLMKQKYGIAHTTIQIEFENWTSRPGHVEARLPLYRGE
jgi:cobalt-zinc-cadmium efflux system protein